MMALCAQNIQMGKKYEKQNKQVKDTPHPRPHTHFYSNVLIFSGFGTKYLGVVRDRVCVPLFCAWSSISSFVLSLWPDCF